MGKPKSVPQNTFIIVHIIKDSIQLNSQLYLPFMQYLF